MSADANFYPVCVTWEEDCSGFEPGARWVYGGEYYVVKCAAWVPVYIEETMDEETYLTTLREDLYHENVYAGSHDHGRV